MAGQWLVRKILMLMRMLVKAKCYCVVLKGRQPITRAAVLTMPGVAAGLPMAESACRFAAFINAIKAQVTDK